MSQPSHHTVHVNLGSRSYDVLVGDGTLAMLGEAMVARYGLVGAPGGMFSPAPEATLLVRLTAAVTLADVERVGGILEQLLEQARG